MRQCIRCNPIPPTGNDAGDDRNQVDVERLKQVGAERETLAGNTVLVVDPKRMAVEEVLKMHNDSGEDSGWLWAIAAGDRNHLLTFEAMTASFTTYQMQIRCK